MAAETTFAPQWTKLIARAWVDPSFKAQLESDPGSVLESYGIDSIGGKNLHDLAGKISVVDAADAGQKPHMDGDTLVLPFPQAPRSYDTVVDPDAVAVVGAGNPGNPHTNWETEHGGTATVWTSGTPGVRGVETGQGPNDSKTPGGAPKNQKHSVPSVPSVPSAPDDDDDGDAAADGDAGADAAEAGADVGEAAGGDAAADAAAAAAALCG